MQYNEACGERLSRLGFGCMRLPLTADKAIDEAADRLSTEKQMLLYSRAASPAALGKQMRAEREQAGADTAEIDRRAQVLKTIYNEVQWQEFQAEYKLAK